MAAHKQKQRPKTLPTPYRALRPEQNAPSHDATQSDAGQRARTASPIVAQNTQPTRLAALIFRAKSLLLQARRAMQNARSGTRRIICVPLPPEQFLFSESGSFGVWRVVGESRTALYSDAGEQEQELQSGKVQNLRRAVYCLHGMTLPAGKLFSFWKQVGRATRLRGYVAGRQLQEGCLFPAIGGGLCQLSNALYDVAMQAGCEIVERHPHTRIVPGSAAQSGRDATVAWNYIDLRFRAAYALYLEAFLTRDALIVRLYARSEEPAPDAVPGKAAARLPLRALPLRLPLNVIPAARSADARLTLNPRDHSCVSCGESACFRHDAPDVRALRARSEAIGAGHAAQRTALLLDEATPEFAAYVQAQYAQKQEGHEQDGHEQDAREPSIQGQQAQKDNAQAGMDRRTRREENPVVFVPVNGARTGQARYAWDVTGLGRVHTALLPTLHRATAARRLAHADAAVRRQAQIDGAERVAASYARRLPWDAAHVVVAQSLLPFLWRDGHLGGRTFDVLMSSLPMDALHARLDDVFALHPERRLLRDFRAHPDLVRAERDALNAARRILTPHADIAAQFGRQAVKLDWQMPPCRPVNPSLMQPLIQRRIAFPGPTHARKGAYELRDAIRASQVEVVLTGGELEGAGFWQGVTTRRIACSASSNKNGDNKDGNANNEDTHWLDGVAVVVQPAVVEDRPRRLLEALSRGVPVIATPACGLGDLAGVTIIPAGDTDALREAIARHLPPS